MITRSEGYCESIFVTKHQTTSQTPMEEAIEKRTRMRYARLRLGLEQHRGGRTSPSPIRSPSLKIIPIVGGWDVPGCNPNPKWSWVCNGGVLWQQQGAWWLTHSVVRPALSLP